MFSRLYKKLVQKWLNLSRKRRAFYTTLFSVVLLIIIIPFSAKATVGASIASFLASIIGMLLIISGVVVMHLFSTSIKH